jgi:hypothetical protein
MNLTITALQQAYQSTATAIWEVIERSSFTRQCLDPFVNSR